MKSAIYSIQIAFSALGGWDGFLYAGNLCGYRLSDRHHVSRIEKMPVQRGQCQGCTTTSN